MLMGGLEFTHLSGGIGCNYIVSHQGREVGVYKTRRNEAAIRNEIAAWHVDRTLGLQVVPFVCRWTGPHGAGVLVEYIENHGPVALFADTEGQRVAVLDYVMASGDRHMLNSLRRTDGRIAAIDNEYALPERLSNGANMMRSVYVASHLNRPLDGSLVQELQGVDPQKLAGRLQSLGYSPMTAGWSAARLAEIQFAGRITGENWGCAILNGLLQVVYPAGYSNISDYWADHPPIKSELIG